MVDDNTPANDRNAVELTMMSYVVIDYEKEHYPIGKPTVAQLIQLSLDKKNMSQKQLSAGIGVSPSRISDYVSGRAPDFVIAPPKIPFRIVLQLACASSWAWF